MLPFRREFDRVVDEVDEHLLHAFGICINRRQVGGDIRRKEDAFGRGVAEKHSERFRREVLERDRP
jgi:hypothetical protein